MAFASSLPKLAPALLLSLALLASLTIARVAKAQSIDPILTSSITRRYSDRGANQNPLWVSYDDCINDDIMQFGLKIRNNAGYTLQVWAIGEGDCTDREERTGLSANCWLVFEDRPNDIDLNAKIPVRAMAAQTTGSQSLVQGSRASCNTDTSANGANRTLWFMLVDGNADLKGQAVSYTTTVDLVGPIPPTDVRASAGEERLQVKWSGNASTDLLNYDLYCVPGTATASVPRYPFQAATDAGDDAGTATDDAGTGGTSSGGTGGTSSGGTGGTSSGGTGGSSDNGGSDGNGTDAGTDAGTDDSSGMTACGVTTLVQGKKPPDDLEKCGTASRTGGFATGLINGVTYAVAVAGVDTTGNHGVLSNIACGTPEVVTDFYELYEQAGGKGGGGFCAIRSGGVAGKGFGAWGLFSLLGALCFWRRRAAR